MWPIEKLRTNQVGEKSRNQASATNDMTPMLQGYAVVKFRLLNPNKK